ncbi:MAG: hypothetical protein EPO21_03890 [Chloroflexota bacterium]|nr:MAG: hypothetical protein EPO21_03890 [Chloroflexota bacterium]
MKAVSRLKDRFSKRADNQTLEENTFSRGTLSLRDLVAPHRFQQTLTTYSLGDGHVARVWRVYDYLSPCSRPRIEELYALPFELRFLLHAERIDDFVARQSLEHQRAMLGGQQQFSASRGQLQSYVSQATLESVDTALRELDGPRRDSLFYFSLLVQLNCRTGEELERQSKELELAFKNVGFMAATCDGLMEEAYRSMLPLGRPEVRTDRLMNASGVTLFFPFYHAEYVDPDGFYFGVHRQSATLVVQNIFKGNGNTVLVGRPGSGKSALFKTVALQAACYGMDVYLLDLEDEYRPLVEALHGTYIDMSPQGGAHVNAMRLDPEDPDGYAGQYADIQALIEVINRRGLDAAESSVLNTCLIETYRQFGIDVEDDGTWSVEPQPRLEHLCAVLESSPTLRERDLAKVGQGLALVLEPYVAGPYRDTFSQDTNVDLRNRVIGFGFAGIRDDHLKVIRVFQALRLIGGRALSGKRLSLIGVDEAWWYFGQAGAVEALSAFSRRCRKRGASVWFLTHQPEDFLAGPDTRQILSSAQTVILMNLARGSAEELRKVCELSDREIDDITNLSPGSFVLVIRDAERHVTHHIPVELVVVPRWWEMLDTSYRRVEEASKRESRNGEERRAGWA